MNFNFIKLEHWKFLTVIVDIVVVPIIRGFQSVSLSRLATAPLPPKKRDVTSTFSRPVSETNDFA